MGAKACKPSPSAAFAWTHKYKPGLWTKELTISLDHTYSHKSNDYQSIENLKL